MRDHDERARIPLGRCTTELIRDRCRRAAEDRFSLAVGTRRHSGVDRRFQRARLDQYVLVTEISVLFLTRYPVEGASSRYRVYQYLPHLEKLGVRCDAQSFMDTTLYDLSFTSGAVTLKVVKTIAAAARRLMVLQHWRKYDIIFMQRELLPFGPPLIERYLRSKGCCLVFDYDDALFYKEG